MSIPREGSRDTTEGIIVSCTPDVCKTPVGSSLVPIPYSITAVQGDDANTVPTVRMTGLRAHNMGSLTTKCTGDAPGTGTGVKSGTVGSVCEPKGHSGTVRIAGKWAVRHGDEWWMNSRNTVGKLAYVKSTESFGPTPAIALAQDPEREAPEPVRLAQNAYAGTMSDAMPGFLQGANRVARVPATSVGLGAGLEVAGIVGMLAAAGVGLHDWSARNDAAALQASASQLGLNLDDPQQAYLAYVHAFARQNFVSGTILSPIDNIPASGPTRDIALLAITEHAGAKPGSFEDLLKGDPEAKKAYEQAIAMAQAEVQLGVTTDTVRVTEEEKKKQYPCLVGPYEEIKDICVGEAHHIIPDMAYRLGARPVGAAMSSTADRIPNAPTLNQGMCICLTPAQHGSGPTGIHGRMRPKLNALGAASPVAGTAPMGAIALASLSEINAIPDISEECKELAAVRTLEQVTKGPGLKAPGRTREAPLPSGEARRVLAAGSY